MALATKCPQCEALFRVVADQLKLRGGLVRCGQCRAVFDAIGSLTYVDDGALSQVRSHPADDPRSGPPTVFASHESPVQERPVRESPVRESPVRESLVRESPVRHATGPATTLRITPVPPATLAGSLPPRVEPDETTSGVSAVIRRHVATPQRRDAQTSAADDPAERIAERSEPASSLDAGDEVSGELPSAAAAPEPAVDAKDASAQVPAAPVDTAVDHAVADAPPASFARPKRVRPRGFSIVYGGGTALLVLLAVVQFAVIFRGQFLVHWPQSRPMLDDLCVVFGCTVHWPTQADRLAVLGTELQSIPGTDVLELNAVIRNRAEFRQSLPAIEVTLTDARNRAVARKVFTPADYLASAGEPTARLEEGMAPGSDHTIRIFFEARGLAPAGFLVYPFYL